MNGSANAAKVDALGSAISRGDSSLGSIPGLLKQVLAEPGAWRDFVTLRGDHEQYERFAEFVVAEPLSGLGADVALIRKLVADDTEAEKMLDDVLKNPVGNPDFGKTEGIDDKPIVDIINDRPTGTGRNTALRRLGKDCPELLAEVLAGNLSPHAAMVKAGYRPARFTVFDSPEAVAATLRRRWTPEQVAELALLLTRETTIERNNHA